jgi:hypothetical protein
MQMEPRFGGSFAASVVMTLLFGAVAVGALWYRSDRWPTEWPRFEDLPEQVPTIVAAVAGGLALTGIISGIHYWRRWRTARRVERLSDDPRLSSFLPDVWDASAAPRAAAVPPLSVEVVQARRLPKLVDKLRTVDDGHNVVGRPPLRIAYLRLFENGPRTRSFVEGAWREFGTVIALRSAASVTPAELKQAQRAGDVANLFVDSHDALSARLAAGGRHAMPKGRHAIHGVAPTTVKVRDKYGCYPMVAVLCHGRFWKAAVDDLLGFVDLVVLDLSGYTAAHAGTHHELQRIVDVFPIERVVVLADPSSNTTFLVARIQETWTTMASTSPNATPTTPRQVLLAITDRLQQSTSTDSNGNSSTRVRLVADRKRTRQLATMAQGRLPG